MTLAAGRTLFQSHRPHDPTGERPDIDDQADSGTQERTVGSLARGAAMYEAQQHRNRTDHDDQEPSG